MGDMGNCPQYLTDVRSIYRYSSSASLPGGRNMRGGWKHQRKLVRGYRNKRVGGEVDKCYGSQDIIAMKQSMFINLASMVVRM